MSVSECAAVFELLLWLPLQILISKSQNLFEDGCNDVFEVELQDIGDLMKIRLGHDDSSPSADWYCDLVTVRAKGTGNVWVFDVDSWFDSNRGDKKIVREFFPTSYHVSDIRMDDEVGTAARFHCKHFLELGTKLACHVLQTLNAGGHGGNHWRIGRHRSNAASNRQRARLLNR